MKKKRVGEINTKDIAAFIFRCLGIMLFPIFLLMPVIVIWRLFFYTPEEYWSIVKIVFLYVMIIVFGVWLGSYKTILEYDKDYLYIIKKRCFLFDFRQKKIVIADIKQITFAEISTEDKKGKEKLKKFFHLKLFYGLIYKIGSLLLNRGRLIICLAYGNEQGNVFKITDIKKNDERYQYLRNLNEQLIKK